MNARTLLLSTAFAALAAVSCVAAPQATSSTEEQAVLKAANQFYDAIDKVLTGDAKPMEAVWSHADDVTYMGPDGGFATGWEQVSEVWNQKAEKKAGGKVAPTDMRAVVGDELATVHGYQEGNIRNADGSYSPFKIRATSVFRNENGNWKMVSHHADEIPGAATALGSPSSK